MKKALIIVDPQCDFFEGGALGIVGSLVIIPVINSLIAYAVSQGWTVIVTRDWHPEVTKHFQEYGGTWKKHCVQNTTGADFHPDITLPDNFVLISKGMSDSDDGYSPFEGETVDGQTLDALLQELGIVQLYVAGLATDYCVKAGVLDACRLDYEVVVVEDAIMAVNINQTDAYEAMCEMIALYAHIAKMEDIIYEKI